MRNFTATAKTDHQGSGQAAVTIEGLIGWQRLTLAEGFTAYAPTAPPQWGAVEDAPLVMLRYELSRTKSSDPLATTTDPVLVATIPATHAPAHRADWPVVVNSGLATLRVTPGEAGADAQVWFVPGYKLNATVASLFLGYNHTTAQDDLDWKPVPLADGYTSDPDSPVQYAVWGDTVLLGGRVLPATTFTGLVNVIAPPGALPVGCRPSKDWRIAVAASPATNNGVPHAILTIGADGSLTVRVISLAVGNATWASVQGLFTPVPAVPRAGASPRIEWEDCTHLLTADFKSPDDDPLRMAVWGDLVMSAGTVTRADGAVMSGTQAFIATANPLPVKFRVPARSHAMTTATDKAAPSSFITGSTYVNSVGEFRFAPADSCTAVYADGLVWGRGLSLTQEPADE